MLPISHRVYGTFFGEAFGIDSKKMDLVPEGRNPGVGNYEFHPIFLRKG